MRSNTHAASWDREIAELATRWAFTYEQVMNEVNRICHADEEVEHAMETDMELGADDTQRCWF